MNTTCRTLLKLLFLACALMNISGLRTSLSQTRTEENPPIDLHPIEDIVAVADETELLFYNLRTGTFLRSISDFEWLGYDVAWSPDGSRIAVTDGPDVEIWTDPLAPQSTEPTARISYFGIAQEPQAEGYVNFVAWSPDATQIAIAIGSYISVWDAQNTQLLLEVGGTWFDFALGEERYFAAVSGLEWPSSDVILFSTTDGHVFTYSISQQRVTHFVAAPIILLKFPYVGTMAVSQSNSKVAFPESDAHTVYIWDFTNDPQYKSVMTDGAYDENTAPYVDSIAWRPDDRVIASVGEDRLLHLWDSATGQQYDIIQLPGDAGVRSIVWSRDGAKIIYATAGGSIGTVELDSLPPVIAAATPEPTPTP